MRLATVMYDGKPRVVAVMERGTLLDLAQSATFLEQDPTAFADMLSLIHSGEQGLAQAAALLDLAPGAACLHVEEVSFLPPILPVQYRDCLAFKEHLENSFSAAERLTGRGFSIPKVWYRQPIYYKGNRMSFVGHGADVIWPNYAEHLDLELELAIVIGKQGKDITLEQAPDHIFGYTILNDISARDAQMAEMAGQLGPAKGKDFDTGNIIGPYILTADEVPHPATLEMQVRVNGEHWGGGNSRDMQHDFGAILAHISASETIYPGELIGSGAVGTGCGMETGRRLNPADQFELEIERIGVLANRIVKEH
ncbi:fumarylacetoacetate hydrolase family protein [Parasedimentitalea huanghaiensis]|uniref:Fumarylacetoacetate hydrolase family protein n=1 Tax=Parasedimentitalea huanghaiensis TaxID=2682100 RepID=A0A6L6WEB4_9RHOB|nr:fumarylacetoacetate hydrolase family protein [Zongyanglinia huanghaiensis]MVO15628.1 fumarylacetoacetate hydrolase family protein [Zongyanglinia huanghaiensis]